MIADISELLIGAYLQVVEQCEILNYNARFQGGGMMGLNEIDLIGFNLQNSAAFICEVAIHLHGLRYGNSNRETLDRISNKFNIQQQYARNYLQDRFLYIHYMFWSPVVPQGALVEGLRALASQNLEIIINEEFATRIQRLQERAREINSDIGNPAFRLLQILAHL